MKKESKLIELKRKYEKYRKKYNLPSFDELNKEFDIEKLKDDETMFLLRNIRRHMEEKIVSFANFFDGVLSLRGIIAMMISKRLEKEKDVMLTFIEKTVRIILRDMKRELDYDEKKEAEEIKFLFEEWKNLKQDLMKIMDMLDKKIESKESRKYYG